ncbi:RBBP9/YdeN family alpha/beta hydrolase [Roseateles cellulosilyticus]|uniref:Alpha/beta hydrolase n=1 Tax=Pelomonas cellulosilytica TaxID=2906762 RepID=A0ABS8XZL7_9BURK|nr:alpha/beta hydrolase [Pelomonas sp. P8]MCE4556720.1 alpha/beta hydrolase [Pelomonas sp. P8]
MPYSPPRLLIIPGLHDSGPAHWQTWLQGQYRDARRVTQRDPSKPELERWAERIQRSLEVAATSDGRGEWLAIAHSFGCLALARHLADHPDSPIREALFVAPAEPDKFGIAESLPHQRLHCRARLLASSNDPWMSAASAARWAHRWGASFSNLGAVGHINAEAGFGPLPVAKAWVDAARARHAAEHRPRHADFREWAFAV